MYKTKFRGALIVRKYLGLLKSVKSVKSVKIKMPLSLSGIELFMLSALNKSNVDIHAMLSIQCITKHFE